MLPSSSLVSCHDSLSPRARGLFIRLLDRNHCAPGLVRILINVKKPSVEIFFPSLSFSAFLPAVPQEPDPFFYGEWQILWGGPPRAGWRGACRSPRVAAAVTSVVADTCWATRPVTVWIQFPRAGLPEGRIRLGDTFSGAPSGFTRTLGWCIGVTRIATNSEARRPGFEPWFVHSRAVLPRASNLASL